MAAQDLTSLVAGATGLGLISLCTIPALWNLMSSVSSSKKYCLPKVYIDKDGTATEESTAKFSAKIPKAVIAVLTILGFSIATTIAVLGTLSLNKDALYLANWINCGAWVCRETNCNGPPR